MGCGIMWDHTLKTTGKAVAFTGMTLAVGVCPWAFSPIKFQADMGILLTFMFLWNMIGALCLLPALVRLLTKGADVPVGSEGDNGSPAGNEETEETLALDMATERIS